MQFKPLTFAILSALTLSCSVSAESANDDTLVVSASKQTAKAASSRNVALVTVDESTLAEANVSRTDQLSRVLPGLQTGNSGSLIFQTISLRGISSASDYYNPAVSFYVDGVPQLSTYAMAPLLDVSSVEMLRGPQGTLYGRSAQGGVINIVTHQPDSTARGYIEGGYASRDGYHSKLNVSGPIQDGLLYGSATLLRQVDQGSMTNPATGSDHLGGSRMNAGNVKLRLAPDNQPWELNASLTEECTHATQDTYVPYNQVKSRTLDVLAGGSDPYLRRCTHSQSLSGKLTTDNWIFSVVGAWQQQQYQREFPYSYLTASIPERWNQNVQEIRAATRGNSSLDAVFGLYREAIHESLDSAYRYAGTPYLSTVAATSSETLAAYSDLTWHITDAFDLGGGLRVSHDRAKTGYSGTSLGIPWGDRNQESDNQLLGQVSAGYQLNEAWRLYGRIAQGYKPAGFSYTPTAFTAAQAYAAEKSLNYELGSRYESRDITLAGALFYTHTRNLQLYSGPVGYQTLSNAGKADATGAEASASWQFAPGWRWAIDGNYVHSTFAGDSENYAGQRVPFVPRFAGSTSVTGTINTTWGALMPRAAINLTGPQYFDGDNTLRQGSYSTTDLRLGWQATDRVTVSAYLDNVFDRRYRTYGFVQAGSAYAQVNQGRTAGLDVQITLF
ncbi:TonB-dependent siderophore receptor [Pantoea sp. A4]|uniref:TonB-dependent siderophore receptor n=1 Tax=Pantoea sp. A4 TaxID=1225184 RepID=UPI00036C7AFA|nr:TonB-dependent siderophore receptor [Pantoea sp. A4]